MSPKQRAALASLDHLADGMIVGMGSGTTADCFIDALGAAIAEGRFAQIRGIPTSLASEQRARTWNIPIVQMPDFVPDITVDGADEIDPELHLIKGLGGALLREKIVAEHSRKLIIIADESKVVSALGTKHPLPVEVVRFAHQAQARRIESLGGTPELRINADGSPYVTDNGNFIYHCRFQRIDDPSALQAELKRHAGIVETGLFINLATLAIIAGEGKSRVIHPRSRKPA